MLVLPTGQVLFELATSQLYVYTPDGSAQAAWKPTVTHVSPSGSSYTLTGTQLNGLTVGSVQGMSLIENDTNYPIVQLTAADGKVYYARTSNWSSTGVATGSTPVTTQFALPGTMPLDSYSLRVIANGIASDPVTFIGGKASATDIYVWDITTETQTKKGKNEARVSAVVRRDSNANGASGSNDAVLSNVNVTVQLRTSSGALIGTASGTTNNQGVFTSSWFSNLTSRTYVAEVTGLSRSGYAWNKVLDPTPNDTDVDGDNLPDHVFGVGTSTALVQSGTTLNTVSSVSLSSAAEQDYAVTPNNSPKLKSALVDLALNDSPRRRYSAIHTDSSDVADELFAGLST